MTITLHPAVPAVKLAAETTMTTTTTMFPSLPQPLLVLDTLPDAQRTAVITAIAMTATTTPKSTPLPVVVIQNAASLVSVRSCKALD